VIPTPHYLLHLAKEPFCCVPVSLSLELPECSSHATKILLLAKISLTTQIFLLTIPTSYHIKMTITKNQPTTSKTSETDIVVEAHVMNEFPPNKPSSPLPTAVPVVATATTVHHHHHHHTESNCNCRRCHKAERKYQRRHNKCQVLRRTPGGRVGFVLLSVPLSMAGAIRPKTTTKVITNHVKRDIADVKHF